MGDPIKWYVNLPVDSPKRQGDRVPIAADAKSVGGKAHVVDWALVAEGKNTKKTFLSAAQRGRLLKSASVNQDDQFRTELKLPPVGGDRFTVQCRKRGGGPKLETSTIETWRKVFVSVHHMNANAKSIFDAIRPTVEAVFKKVFVELQWEPSAPTKTLVDEPWTSATPTHLPHLYDFAKQALKHPPHHLRLVLVNELYERVNHTYGPLEVRKADCTASGERRYRFARPVGWTKADTGCKRALVSLGAGTPWRDVTDLVRKDGEDGVAVELRQDALAWAQLTAGNPVWLHLKTNEREHGFNGYCLHNFCTLKTNRSDGAAGIAKTFVHEVGHALHQSTLWEREFDEAGQKTGYVKNTDWHDDRQGGQGPHCHHGAKLVPSTRTKSGKIWDWNGKPLCVMFFCSDPHREGGYCAACEPRLKRTDLGAKAMTGGALKNWPPQAPMNWSTYP